MKRIISAVLIATFLFLNVATFIGCESASAAPSKEVRACWVCSIGNMDFPSKQGLSAKELRKEIDRIVNNCKKTGLNTIFFQVRPNGDALYKSEVFPWSNYISGKQGVAPKDNFDPLTYFIEAAHKNGIELHAWINPYRIGSGKNVRKNLSSDNPAVRHPEYTVESNSGLYYNPGLPESRKLILDGIAEIVRNYDVDGIHFDDYFYPYDMSGFDDSAAFKKYGNGRTIENFRRDSVNELVKSAYSLIKSIDSSVEFGISPAGIWANKGTHPEGSDTRGMSAYSQIFADSKKWVEKHWVDYICPQVYWSFDLKAAPFAVVVDWWSKVCQKAGVKLYIGMALYKIETDEVGWDEPDQISRQLEYASKKPAYAGHCFFRYADLIKNPLKVTDSIKKHYAANPQKQESIQTSKPQAVQPTVGLKVTSPQNGATIDGAGVSVSGVAAAGQSVTVNGIKATVSSKGFFAAYIPLTPGKNTVKVQSGGLTKTITVNRSSVNVTSVTLNADTLYPQGTAIYNAGDLVEFSVQAPSNGTLVLKNEAVTIPMVAQAGSTTYTAQWTVPAFPMADKLALNGFKLCYVDAGGVATEVDANLELQLHRAYRIQRYLKTDAYIFSESRDGSQMDNQPLAQGSTVFIIGEEGTRCLTENGYWVEKSVLSEKPILTKELSKYSYEKITFTADKSFSYRMDVDETQLKINLIDGRDSAFLAEEQSSRVAVKQEYAGSNLTVSLSSDSGKSLAGYEVIPREDGIDVYLRFGAQILRGRTILLDAGHGGTDSGALGPGGKEYPSESDLNLILAQALKTELEKSGATVMMTRADDSTLDLDPRVEISRNKAPDLFISLHHNSVDQATDYNSVSGGLVLYSSPLSKGLAEKVAAQLWNGISNQGSVDCRRQSLRVCRQTRCPAILIEAGFLCNPIEYEKMCSENIAAVFAQNIKNGIESYLSSGV